MSNTNSKYETSWRDRVVPLFCNWLLRKFTSRLYYAWTMAIMVEGRVAIEKKLASGELLEMEKGLSHGQKDE